MIKFYSLIFFCFLLLLTFFLIPNIQENLNETEITSQLNNLSSRVNQMEPRVNKMEPKVNKMYKQFNKLKKEIKKS